MMMNDERFVNVAIYWKASVLQESMMSALQVSYLEQQIVEALNVLKRWMSMKQLPRQGKELMKADEEKYYDVGVEMERRYIVWVMMTLDGYP